MEFRILGPLEVTSGDRSVPLRAAKLRALLGLLLVRSNEVVSSTDVIEALWAGRPPPSAPKLVHVYVAQVRAVLEPGRASGAAATRLVSRPGGYVLRVDAEEVDRMRFEKQVEQGRASLDVGDFSRAARELAAALALWRGHALADFRTEHWARHEAERLEEARLAALEDRIDADLGCGRPEQVVGELRMLVADHPLRERLRARLMVALYRSGRQAEALEAYREAREALVEGLGLEPGDELQSLHHAILNRDASLTGAPVDAVPPTNLPLPPTRLVGRRRELAELGELLARDDTRLVTMTGPGGSGKTRLALEVARESLGRFRDGVFLVDLAAVAEPELVTPAIAAVLGVKESGHRPLTEQLEWFLGERRLLLLLDNFEHLTSAGSAVAELVRKISGLKILVTSRSILRLSAEHVYAVQPLELPAPAVGDPERLLACEAVELLVERVKRVRPGLELNGDTVRELADICVRLDGLPLALELAGARLRMLTPTDLLERLEPRLPQLTEGDRDVPARQRTLEAAIGWSYGLLGPDDQALFRRLGVFAGSWTLASAEALCRDEPAPAVADGLGRLLEINLVHLVFDGDEGRFALLETIREFALDRLAEAGEEVEVGERHAGHYLALAERERAELRGSGQAGALVRLEREHANLRAAIGWACRAGRGGLGLRLAASLWRFWWVRGYLVEGRRWLAEALAVATPAGHEEARATALEGAAALAWGQGDGGAAEAYAAEALAIFRASGDSRGVARALNHLGLVAQARGAYQRARGFFRESGTLAQELGNERGHAVATVNLSGLALIEGDYENAQGLSRESLRLHREQESRDGEAISLLNLGLAGLELKELDEASRLLEESLECFRELGFVEYVSFCLEGLAGVADAREQPLEAARLLGHGNAVREAAGGSLGPFEQRLHERTVASTLAALGEARFAAEHARGRAEQAGPLTGSAVRERRPADLP